MVRPSSFSVKPSRTTLYRRSRDTRFLARIALTIAVVSVAIGAAISAVTLTFSSRPFFERAATIEGDFSSDWRNSESGAFSDLSFNDWAAYLRSLASIGFASRGDEKGETSADGSSPGNFLLPEVLEEIDRSEVLSDSEKTLMTSFAKGMLGEKSTIEEAALDLEEAVGTEPTRPLLAEMLGDARSRTGDRDGAIDAYRLEVDSFPDTAHRSLHLLILFLKRGDRGSEVTELMERPDLRPHLKIGDRIDHAIDQRDFLTLLFLTLRHDLRFDDPWLLVLSLFAAAIWFVIITQYSGRWRSRFGFYLAAVALGFLSGSLTLYAALLQEKVLHFVHDPSANLVDQLLYCIAGIGLREETLKLLLFLPLVPFLARSDRDEIDALVCAGLVGLGFALNENSGYVIRGGEFTTWSRFITANFFHIALTGVVGLSAVRCWRRPKRQWDNFLYDFLIVVAAHGVYDAFLLVPQFAGYDIVSLVIFAVICYLFLDQATQLMRPQNSMTVSPLAVFVVGSALLMGVVLCFACWAVPFRVALSQYSAGLGSMIPIAFVFISRLRNL